MTRISFPNFPNSHRDPFLITSTFTTNYNCIAWAYGDDTKWYWPDPDYIFYWPPGIPREITIEAFIELFRSIGYDICPNGDKEENIEKIAIFTDNNGEPKHAARQLPEGIWTSKLGPNIDVSHSITSMEGGEYGNVRVYMFRNL
ncbi:hypothetical protein GTQ34_07285 [Muricauda sp. JGD-17]|uniref:DUF7689 domain-containing protein n=1 Tax=Flagellimonas ochracea TaxID=2696472 RepID=A0A964TBB1_9FLAO|nr:hypothetical protein [Allomuricauda ochracea]NAY91714.1 hypothetical protein [Allomuricauda ochracea]